MLRYDYLNIFFSLKRFANRNYVSKEKCSILQFLICCKIYIFCKGYNAKFKVKEKHSKAIQRFVVQFLFFFLDL